MNGLEWFGTAASVVVALSLMQRKLLWLRVLNLIGASSFALYGFFLGSWPVFGLNTFIALIDIYYLTDLLRRKERFSHYFCDPSQDAYCTEFLRYYRKDIIRFYPSFPAQTETGLRGCLILRNLVPVSLILYRQENEEQALILLDYATPPFRDFRSIRYFLDNGLILQDLKGIKTLHAQAETNVQAAYYRKIGYKAGPGDNHDFFYRSGLFC